MQYFYHNSIKNYTIAMLDLFNDIHIPRYNEDGEREKDIIVPIKFGNRDKAFMLNDNDIENLTSGNVNVLPRFALEFNSMSKALDRNTNKNLKINKTRKGQTSDILNYEYHYNAVAYDFDFTLYLGTRTFTDATIVIEQIAPMFRPDISLKIQELDIQTEPTTVPVSIGEFDISLPDPDPDEFRIIEVSVPLTLKGNLYLPIKEQAIIKEIDINMSVVEARRDKKSREYEIEVQSSKAETDSKPGMTKKTRDQAETKITYYEPEKGHLKP